MNTAAEFRAMQLDTLEEFLSRYVTESPDPADWVNSDLMYTAYLNWTLNRAVEKQSTGAGMSPLTKTTFFREMRKKYIKVSVLGTRVYSGIKLDKANPDLELMCTSHCG